MRCYECKNSGAKIPAPKYSVGTVLWQFAFARRDLAHFPRPSSLVHGVAPHPPLRSLPDPAHRARSSGRSPIRPLSILPSRRHVRAVRARVARHLAHARPRALSCPLAAPARRAACPSCPCRSYQARPLATLLSTAHIDPYCTPLLWAFATSIRPLAVVSKTSHIILLVFTTLLHF